MAHDVLLSPEEKEICDCVASNRLNLCRFAQDFILSVQLFELLERGGGPPNTGIFGGVFIRYRIIAAKEGVLNIYHFGCSLDALRKQVLRCPITRDSVDTAKLKKSFSLFNKYFPHANNIRHAVAHAGEIWASIARAREHIQREDSAIGSLLAGGLFEKTYSIGWEGKVFEVQMDTSTIQKLTEIMLLADSAFS